MTDNQGVIEPEAGPSPGANRKTASVDAEFFVLAGATRRELLEQLHAFGAQLSSIERPLIELAASMNLGLPAGGERLAMVAASHEQLQQRVERALQRLADDSCRRIHDVGGIYYDCEPLTSSGSIAWLFPGEGSQYLGMLAGLIDRFPWVGNVYEACDRNTAAPGEVGKQVSRFTHARQAWTDEEAAELEAELRQIDNAMYSVFMANWAMYAVIEQLGLRPDAIAGHSGGELAALVVAGVFDPEENLGLLGGTMEALMTRDAEDHALLAVGAPREALARIIAAALADRDPDGACVAMDNCPHQSIAVGDAASIAAVEALAIDEGLMCERLALGRPYHTERFEPYMAPLRKMFGEVTFNLPQLPLYSCTTGERFPDDPEAIRQLALSHWCAPVEFTKLIDSLYRDGVRIFLEIGPRNNLSSFVDDILRDRPHLAIPSNTAHRPAVTQLQHLAAQLVAQHVPIRLDALYGRDVRPRQRRTVSSARGAVMREFHANAEQFLDVQRLVHSQYFGIRGRRPRGSATAGRRRDVIAGRKPALAAPPSETPPPSHPMLGTMCELDPGRKLVARRTLDPTEDVYAAHHTVGGRSISRVDPNQHGLAIMPMTFTLEMMMEAASALLPDRIVLGVKDVRLSRWLPFYETDFASIELVARVTDGGGGDFPGGDREVLVEVKDLGRASQQAAEQKAFAAIGTVVLGQSRPQAPAAGDFSLRNEQPCHIDVETTYNNLFHGNLLRGLTRLHRYGDEGIEGTIRVLPRDDLFASCDVPSFVGDPVLLDVAMHPAVTWHLEQPCQAGRIMLPFELARLQLFGPMPTEGDELTSRVRVTEETHWHFTHTVEVFDRSGTLWGRIDRVKLWRFYLPFHDVNFHGPKDVYFLADEWAEAAPSTVATTAKPPAACCVRLKELSDMKQPAMQLVGARVMLSPVEQEVYLSLPGPDDKKAEWLFGRAAAKDAVRILLRRERGERLFMADVEILSDDRGRPTCRRRGEDHSEDYPNISITHADGHIAAMAAFAPHVGIDIERIAPREQGFEQIAFRGEERQILDSLKDRHEWIARFWCAKEAVGKALGCGLNGDPREFAVVDVDAGAGLVRVMLGEALSREFPTFADQHILVTSVCDGEVAAAATLCEIT